MQFQGDLGPKEAAVCKIGWFGANYDRYSPSHADLGPEIMRCVIYDRSGLENLKLLPHTEM